VILVVGRQTARAKTNHHRQAVRRSFSQGEPQGDAGGRRHLSAARRHRPAQDLGSGAPNAPVIAGEPGADFSAGPRVRCARPAAQGRRHRRADDRHRRPVLQNKVGLMGELEKIVRVLKKLDPAAPHAVLARARRGPSAQNAAVAGGRVLQDRRRHRARHDQARRHRARAASWSPIAEENSRAYRFTSSASARAWTTWSRSPRKDFARAIAGLEA